MASSLRIITVKRGEQAIVKVNSDIPITLEFDGHSITLWARGGMVFQRMEVVEQETQVEEECDIEPYEETQLMFTPEPSPRKASLGAVLPHHVTIRSRLTMENRKDLQDLQTELFYLDAGDTQVMD